MALPYQKHSPTSKAAALGAAPHALGARERVFNAVAASACGLTDEEIQDRLGMNPSTQRPRRIELVADGLVRDMGLSRQTKSGTSAVVWVVTGLPFTHSRKARATGQLKLL
ncbi:MAG TPA: hypothetical protein VIK52_11075 [Opitutaceae bacterium]